jgi:hypothetical protein
MAKFGGGGGTPFMPALGGNISAGPVFTDPGSVFRRGEGGILPERGSSAQLAAVMQAMGGMNAGAQQSGSPLLALMAPLLGGAVGSRTQGLYKDAQKGRDGTAIDTLLASMGGGGGAVTGGVAPQADAQNNDVRNLAMAANGGPTKQAADWLQYANQGAIRDQELSPDLVNAMSFLPELGVTMKVISGGQDASGPNRTGSKRHDHGGAADADFYLSDGTKLVPSNPQHLPILTEIIQRGRANGLSGFGEGDDYMGAGRLHVGFGSEGVWGAGGKGANAPDWLTAAFNGSQAPSRSGAASASVAGQPASPQVSRELLEMLVNPDISDPLKALASTMVGTGMKPQQGMSPLDQIKLQQAQVDLQKSMNPEGMSPMDQIKLQQAQIDLQKSMNPEAPDRQRVLGPDGNQYFVDDGSRVLPNVDDPNGGNGGRTGEMARQINQATQILSDAITFEQNVNGLSGEEARAKILSDPLYAQQLKLLEMAGSTATPAGAAPAGSPPPPPPGTVPY